MRHHLLQQATRITKNSKYRKGWQAFVRTMAFCVVFCTTYALILPAITMQQEPICGHTEHTHTAECLHVPQAALTGCQLPADAMILHQHGDLCRNEAGELICPLPETAAHTHGDGCMRQETVLACPVAHVHSEACIRTERTLTCQIPESEGHAHSESCTGTITVQVCGLEVHSHGEGCYETRTLGCQIPESEEHTHSEACGLTSSVLVCDAPIHAHEESCFQKRSVVCLIPETQGHSHGEGCWTETEIPCTESFPEGHVHDDACYRQTTVLNCPLPQVHSHTESCFGTDGNLSCGLAAAVEHIHTEACLVLPESTEPVLSCGLEEHTHETACYPEQKQADPDYLCGFAVHTHSDSCLDTEGNLICSIPVHSHEAACLVADLDLTADVETDADWMRSVSGMTRTGNWPADVLAVAQTQLGYRESAKNVILENGQLKGYTRYGDWYGIPYGDWCAMYASFCLRYAGVEDYPLESGVSRWIEALTEAGFYAAPGQYTGKPGDLIFFDQDQKRDAAGAVPIDGDHMGIVVELIPATENSPAKIKTIEGNVQDRVLYASYELDDPQIIGYGKVPFGKIFRLIHQGPDYTVTVALTAETGLPENVQLDVREILPDTEEYQQYYNQSVEALTASAEEVPAVSFARFFDIRFLVDGVEVEPVAPVDVKIAYHDTIAVTEEENGQIVHFAKDGVEVLTPSTSLTDATAENTEQVDTFQFTQDSFSVTGTLISTKAVTSATRVKPYEIDNTGSTMYVLVAQVGNKYYALSGANGGSPVQVTVSGNNVTLPTANTENLFWTFVDKANDNTAYLYNPVANVGTGRHLHPYNGGAMTDSAWDVYLDVSGDNFKIRGNGSYRLKLTDRAVSAVTDQNQATNFFAAAVAGGRSYNVWFDGTLGGMMSYYGAANTNIPAEVRNDGTAVVNLPETWGSSTKYDYKLRGWYDINTQTYYPVNPDDNIQPTATISGNTVFYADWIAATYDVGQQNDHVVNSLDTNDFITTHVFDYNALFNVMSQSHTGSITAGSHSETWQIYNNGETVPYRNGKSLGFAFVDYDNNGEFSYANNRDSYNISQSGITAGILDRVKQRSGQDLLDLLFNPNTDVIGKYYAGTGNYLFQYMDSTTPNYDGEHDGYYYLDARLNAASYNQSLQRFYLYDYLERTSDSRKDGGAGQYSDLLPFNSPYIFDADQVDSYTDTVRKPGYEYDAKDGGSNHPEYNSLDDAATNYFFGLRTEIEFFLPNDTNTKDEYGNYGNISTRGEHMVFDFHGDDDVWVFVDGKLLLDIGGLHGIMHGRIDFSTGTIAYGADGKENVSTFQMDEGTHHMTVYYMERGSSQSNCAIYFNIAPRYDLEITKEDIVTAEHLDGAVFSIYDDEAMTDPSELWNSFAEHEAGAAPTNTFTVVDGIAKCWGISAGKTYYICETTPPPGYPASDDMIRITLNNRGTATIETTTLHGSNGVATEGFAVIKQNVNDTLKIVALTVTNQKEGDTTEVRVEKTWDENSIVLPEYITVYLTADGVRIGRSARLTESNGWSYTWTGLPKYRAEGVDEEVVYVVEEVFVPDYITVQGDSVKVENYTDWVQVAQLSDSNTFLLVHNGKALTYNGTFGWMTLDTAKNDASGAAHWKVSTDHDGFHLKNELNYTLTYQNGRFTGSTSDDVALNQVFYYLGSRLMVHDHDVYYQFGTNGAAVQEDGLAFQLYQKETLTGLLTNIINKPVDEEKQTFVEVSKIWGDGNELHANDSIIVRLYADGKDTGRSVVLNAANNWQASFDDLPYYQPDNQTPIVYTVAEEKVAEYTPVYSAPYSLSGRPVSFWQNVTALTANNAAHRIFANGYRLSVANNDIVSLPNDLEDETQQWVVETRNNTLVLKNIGTNRYLRFQNNDLTTTANQRDASAVTYTNGYITVGGSNNYLELSYDHVGITNTQANVDRDALRITRWTNSSGMAGTGYTVTNMKAKYELPETGGTGITSVYAFGSLLILAAVMMYVNKFGPKRRKGGV